MSAETTTVASLEVLAIPNLIGRLVNIGIVTPVSTGFGVSYTTAPSFYHLSFEVMFDVFSSTIDTK